MFTSCSNLSRHNKTAAHLKKKKVENTDISCTQDNYVDCGKVIKVEDIKEEIKEEEFIEDALPIDYYTESGVKQEVKEEVKELDE